MGMSKQSTMKSLAIQITKARAEQDITQHELADKMQGEVTLQELVHAENGVAGISLGTLVKIAKALGMVVDVRFNRPDESGSKSKCEKCRLFDCECAEVHSE